MRNIAKTTAVASLIAVLSVGCAGPENKLGRGVRNFTEFTRLGEFSRSVEQTALWDGPQHAYTTGVVRGLSRTMARTAIGFAEIVTFAIPTPDYEPWLQGATVYPDPSVATLDYPGAAWCSRITRCSRPAIRPDCGTMESFTRTLPSDLAVATWPRSCPAAGSKCLTAKPVSIQFHGARLTAGAFFVT